MEEVKIENWRQELKPSPWRNTTYWFAFHSLFSYHFYTAQDHLLRDGTTHSKKMPIDMPKDNLIEAFFSQLRFPLPR